MLALDRAKAIPWASVLMTQSWAGLLERQQFTADTRDSRLSLGGNLSPGPLPDPTPVSSGSHFTWQCIPLLIL